ncbi:MAG: vWA domain-containing protein [Anaerolineae bacterium]
MTLPEAQGEEERAAPPTQPQEAVPQETPSWSTEGEWWEGGQAVEIGTLLDPRRLETNMDRLVRSTGGRRSRTVTTRKRGRYVRAHPSPRDPSDLALDATLRAAAPYQASRHEDTQDGPALRLRAQDYQRKVRVRRAANLVLFVVDASWSMAVEERMEATKGAILSLLTDAYQRRDRVGLIVFRKDRATLVLPPTNSVELAQKKLVDLPVGGKTPLSAGLWLALETVRQEKMRHPELTPLVVVLTDGAGNVSMGDEAPQREAYLVAEAMQTADIHTVVINMETPKFDQGLAQALADHLGGECYTPETLQSEALVKMVRDQVAH